MRDDGQVDGPQPVGPALNSVNVNSINPSGLERKVLYLYSGPSRNEDGFGTYCLKNSLKCDYVDKEYNDAHDVLDQHTWETVFARVPSYDAYLLSPPCSTFTAARNDHDGGPRSLRTSHGPERYGRYDATPQEKQRVREGTLLAMRARDTAKEAQKQKKPWILEQPHWRDGATSMFTLDEFIELMDNEDVHIYTLAQCRYGAQVEKLTDLLSNADLSSLELTCNHPVRWWRIPWSGEWIHARHPPLKGKQLAIPSEEWSTSMLRDREPEGPFVTRAFAAYPAELNKALADKMAQLIQEKPQQVSDVGASDRRPDKLHNEDELDPKVTMSTTLRQQSTSPSQSQSDNLSLRNVHRSMTGRTMLIGRQLGNLIERELDKAPEIEELIMKNVGRKAEEVTVPTKWLDEVRAMTADVLERNKRDGQAPKCDVEPINTPLYQTVVRGRLLEYWAVTTDDPGAVAARWLYEGAPAGLQMRMELDGICAAVEDDSPELDELALATDYDNFTNYDGVEDSKEAVDAIMGYRDKGYLKEFATLDEASAFLGSQPILSKLGCITKEKLNVDTGLIIKKTRIILDCKRSEVSRYATREYKSILPRITDAVRSALQLLSGCRAREEVALYIADVSDAFWIIPLHHQERKYFATMQGGKYYVFLRTAQGSCGAPLSVHGISH